MDAAGGQEPRTSVCVRDATLPLPEVIGIVPVTLRDGRFMVPPAPLGLLHEVK